MENLFERYKIDHCYIINISKYVFIGVKALVTVVHKRNVCIHEINYSRFMLDLFFYFKDNNFIAKIKQNYTVPSNKT